MSFHLLTTIQLFVPTSGESFSSMTLVCVFDYFEMLEIASRRSRGLVRERTKILFFLFFFFLFLSVCLFVYLLSFSRAADFSTLFLEDLLGVGLSTVCWFLLTIQRACRSVVKRGRVSTVFNRRGSHCVNVICN